MYCVDITSDEPIMLINKHIGFDGEEGMGIDGALFQKELLELDAMGKKRIQVWISSPGGVVLDGFNIFNAILKSKTPVDTYNVGIAASIAGVIFMAGRKRIMADYACLMIHPASGSDDKKSMEAITGSLVTMLTAKSNLSEVEVKYLMERTTWINSAECFAKGFCTEIEVTADANKKRMPVASATDMWKASLPIINSTLNISKNTKNSTMTKITMKLGLNDAATEDNVISAIKVIEDRAYKAETEVIDAHKNAEDCEVKNKKEKDELAKKLKDMEKAKADMDETYDKLKAQYDAMEEDKMKAENAAKKVSAESMVDSFAKSGRIKNEASLKLPWITMAIADFEGTKTIIESLPLNKVANVIATENKLAEGELATTAMGLAVKNKLKREGKI